jgi:hypothetical protein
VNRIDIDAQFVERARAEQERNLAQHSSWARLAYDGYDKACPIRHTMGHKSALQGQ